MALKLYLIAGIIVEAFIIKGYAENKVPYTKAEIFLVASLTL